MEEKLGRGGEGSQPMIAFDYIKGNFFRVIHADGVLGGSTPSGNIHMAFFSDRQPIPKREVYGLKPDGSLGDLIIDVCEVSENSIIQNVLAPDLQSYDANGNYAPQRLAMKKDSLSIGLGFTAVRAKF